MNIKNIRPDQIGQLLAPGIQKLIESKLKDYIIKEYDQIVEELSKTIYAGIKGYIESYQLVADNQIVVNLYLNKEKLNLHDD